MKILKKERSLGALVLPLLLMRKCILYSFLKPARREFIENLMLVRRHFHLNFKSNFDVKA